MGPSCPAVAGTTGGAGCTGKGSASLSRPCLMKTRSHLSSWHSEQVKVWRSKPRSPTWATFIKISASHALQRIARLMCGDAKGAEPLSHETDHLQQQAPLCTRKSNNNAAPLAPVLKLGRGAISGNQNQKGDPLGAARVCCCAQARASMLLTDFAYHRPPRGVLMPRALSASAIW
jgi:hypothetical protein